MEKKYESEMHEFLNFYDFSFWIFKMKILDAAINDINGFRSGVKNRLNASDNDKDIVKSLKLDAFFNLFHMIDVLFLLIGAFTYNPKRPWDWINDKENYASKVAVPVKCGNWESLYSELGLDSVDDYVKYLFYDVPTEPEYVKKLEVLISPAKNLLECLSKTYLENKDAYNSYKHGLLLMNGELSVSREDSDGNVYEIFPPFQTVGYLSKQGKMSTIEKNESKIKNATNFRLPMNFIHLDYERYHKMSILTSKLVRSLIYVRRVKVNRKSEAGIEPITMDDVASVCDIGSKKIDIYRGEKIVDSVEVSR